MKEEIRKDLFWFNNHKLPFGIRFYLLLFRSLFNPSFFAIFHYRLARKLIRVPIVPTVIFRFIRFLFGIELPATANIGGGVRFPHPRNIIIASGSVIGEYVTIGQQSTIGGNMGYRVDGKTVPTIGDWCWICANCVVAGPITIGEDVLVGSNTVLKKNTPPHSVVSSSSNIHIHEKVKNYAGNNKTINQFYYGLSEEELEHTIAL